MAKGNLFLGTGRKKLGDVVLYRRNGQQQARVRIRNVANPKSYGQALQRNYLAPVSKFYAPLAGVLEKSWESLNKMDSYQAFLKANIDLARRNGWAVPKGAPFTPLPYKLSKGILPPLTCGFIDDEPCLKTEIPMSQDTTVSGLTYNMQLMGYKEGDQLTVIGVYVTNDGDYIPSWFRLFLNSSDQTLVTEIGNSVLELRVYDGMLAVGHAYDQLAAAAIIVSRFDGTKWLRSTQYLVCSGQVISDHSGEEALQAAIRSYQQGAGLNFSDVYLDGSTQGSEEGDTQLTIPVTLANGQAITLMPQSLAIYDSGQSPAHVAILGVDIANGTSYAVWVFNKIAGSTNENKYIATQNSYGDGVAIGTVTNYAFTSGTGAVIQWLKYHGCNESLFQ